MSSEIETLDENCKHGLPGAVVTRGCRKRQKCDSHTPGCDRGPRRRRREALAVHFAKYEAASENTTTFLPAASSVTLDENRVQGLPGLR